MKELDKKIITWAEEKGIMQSSSPLKQLTKTFEEATELITSLVNKDEKEIIDSIGDVNVTLIILNKLSEVKVEDGSLGNSRVFFMLNWLVEVFKKVCQNKDVKLDIIRAQESLELVAKEHNLTLEQCTQTAYDVFSKRTGEMVNGVFVKDAPQDKPEIVERKDITKKPTQRKKNNG